METSNKLKIITKLLVINSNKISSWMAVNNKISIRTTIWINNSINPN